VIQAVFTAYQDWSSARIMSSIQKMLPTVATVTRDGQVKQVGLSTLVVVSLFFPLNCLNI